MHQEPPYLAEALRAGASGYILKSSESEELIRAIQEVLKDRIYLSPMITKETLGKLMESSGATGEATLTPRQREVLQLISEGHSLKEIAAELHISMSTVEYHKIALMRRLGANSTAELIRYGIAHGITPL